MKEPQTLEQWCIRLSQIRKVSVDTSDLSEKGQHPQSLWEDHRGREAQICSWRCAANCACSQDIFNKALCGRSYVCECTTAQVGATRMHTFLKLNTPRPPPDFPPPPGGNMPFDPLIFELDGQTSFLWKILNHHIAQAHTPHNSWHQEKKVGPGPFSTNLRVSLPVYETCVATKVGSRRRCRRLFTGFKV